MGRKKKPVEETDLINLPDDDLPTPRSAKDRSTEIARYTLAVAKLGIESKAHRNDADWLMNAFYSYVKLTADAGMRVGNMGAYTALGISREAARQWKNGSKGKAFAELIANIDMFCTTYREQSVMSGDTNVVWGIFAAKNFDGMKDQQDFVVSPVITETKTAAEIAEKYKELPE